MPKHTVSRKNDARIRDDVAKLTRLEWADQPASSMAELIREYAKSLGVTLTWTQASEYAAEALDADIDWETV